MNLGSNQRWVYEMIIWRFGTCNLEYWNLFLTNGYNMVHPVDIKAVKLGRKLIPGLMIGQVILLLLVVHFDTKVRHGFHQNCDYEPLVLNTLQACKHFTLSNTRTITDLAVLSYKRKKRPSISDQYNVMLPWFDGQGDSLAQCPCLLCPLC